MPKGFKKWELADEQGNTTAHCAAIWGRLPRGFKMWKLVDGLGDTVAHVAAMFGHLPRTFKKWELFNAKTLRTVQDCYDAWRRFIDD